VTRVAIDARRLQDRPLTGVGRWIINLLPHLGAEFEIILLTDARRGSPGLDGFEEVRLGVPSRLPEPFWLQLSVAAWLRHFDGVFHGTYNAIPLSYRGPGVLSLYDLSWEHHPEDFSVAKRMSFMMQARQSARRARAIVTISEFTRTSIVQTYRLDEQRVFLAPPAVDPIFSPARSGDVAPILERLSVVGPYVVALGGARRRGLSVAVGAWQRLAQKDRPALVVVGPEAPPPQPGIVYAGPLADPEWSAVLAGAQAFCYPTRFEGYGMPAMEAAASGVPVVCARVGPLPEILGDAAEWCATPSVVDVGTALERVTTDSDRRLALRQAGLDRTDVAPTWAESAEEVARAYRMAAQ
jgi:glycosyltransferase involved in cell wall biosynthesis